VVTANSGKNHAPVLRIVEEAGICTAELLDFFDEAIVIIELQVLLATQVWCPSAANKQSCQRYATFFEPTRYLVCQ
jgi:hypothetical protein